MTIKRLEGNEPEAVEGQRPGQRKQEQSPVHKSKSKEIEWGTTCKFASSFYMLMLLDYKYK